MYNFSVNSDDSEYSDTEDSSDKSEVSADSKDDEYREPPLLEITKTDKEVFDNLSELTSDLNLDEPFFPGSNINVLDMLAKLSVASKQFNMSKDCLSQFFSLMELMAITNSSFIRSFNDNFYEMIAKISHKSDTENIRTVCVDCKTAHQDTNAKICPNCNAICKSKFVVNDLKSLLKSMLETRGLAQILESQVDDCFNATPLPSDAQKVYKDLPTSADPLSSIYDLQLIHNSNSFNPHEYEKSMIVWSHLFAIRNLPPLMRTKFVMAGTMISAKRDSFYEISKFYFEETIKPLLEQGLKWCHPVSKLEITSKISIIATTTADPQVERILYQLDSTQACKICDIECSTFELNSDQGPKLKKGQTVRGYLHKAGPLTVRTHFPKFDQEIAAGDGEKNHSKSILNPHTLFLFKDCPIAANYSSHDYFGSCVMGVVRKWTENIFNATKKHQIGNSVGQIGAELEAQLNGFMVPDFCHKPHIDPSLKVEWQHDGYRDWLLFFSLPCLSKRIPKKHLRQHGLLVESMYLLLKSEVTEADRVRAELLLTKYSKSQSAQFPSLRSINLHKHLHFAESVKHLGPLWAHSAYTFDKANEVIDCAVNSTSRTDKPNRLKPAAQLSHAIETLNFDLSIKLFGQVKKMRSNKTDDFILSVPIDPGTAEIQNNAVYQYIGLPAVLAMKTFGLCKVGDFSYYSKLMVKEQKNSSNSYFVAYEDPRKKVKKYALVLAFILVGDKKYFTGKRVLMNEAAFKTSLGCEVSHIRKYSVLYEEFVCEEVKCLRKPLYHMFKLLAEPPNMFEIKSLNFNLL